MNAQLWAVILQEGGKLISEFMRYRPIKRLNVEVSDKQSISIDKQIEPTPSNSPEFRYGVSDAETIAYQEREVGKALTLMEMHLLQKCKIDTTPCDCCEKHPMIIEALAEETYGMTGKPVYSDIVNWTRSVAPITTAKASASGQYEEDYPRLAQEARQLRKRVMGTEDLGALVGPKERHKLEEEYKATQQSLFTEPDSD